MKYEDVRSYFIENWTLSMFYVLHKNNIKSASEDRKKKRVKIKIELKNFPLCFTKKRKIRIYNVEFRGLHAEAISGGVLVV